jgi:hypothetical protein
VRMHAGFHTAAVVALSVATRRTLLATASRDNTVRIWDYHRQTCRALYQAANPVMCVALHPWGTDCIVAFYESAFTYVVAGDTLIKGQRLPESSAGAPLHHGRRVPAVSLVHMPLVSSAFASRCLRCRHTSGVAHMRGCTAASGRCAGVIVVHAPA